MDTRGVMLILAKTQEIENRKSKWHLVCPGGIPSDIIETHDNSDIIDTLGTIGAFHPAPFGIVDILDH